ncbi:hypothetical protein LCGC14_2988930 [marine sediment metagenome]|uniref:Uncharacterized protein n=1 Tax=marine sediment metagenome TaxID=412755 RepID=A0A0F8X586_9ZZZZ
MKKICQMCLLNKHCQYNYDFECLQANDFLNPSVIKQFEKYFDVVLKQIDNQPKDAVFDKYEVSNIVSNIYQKTRDLIKGR